MEFKTFFDLPGGDNNESLEKPKIKEPHAEMFEAMGVSPDDETKITHAEFFNLAIEKFGNMSEDYHVGSRAVILMSVFYRAFCEYFGFKNAKKFLGSDEFSKAFNDMCKRRIVDIIPHKKGRDSFLAIPRPRD